MAKLRAPLFSLSANKTFGKALTFQERQSGSAVYLKSEPGAITPFIPSYRQRDQRAIRGLLMAQWQCMTPSEKLVWENEALASGDSLSGNHYFLKKAQTNLYLYHGLAGYWSFNDGPAETVRDLSGNGNTGTLKPTYPADAPTFVDSVNPKFGKALSFNGSTNYVVCNSKLVFTNANILSFMAWIKSDNVNVRQTVCGNLNEANAFQFEIGALEGCLSAIITGVYVARTNAYVISSNTWYHVAYTRSGSGAGKHKLYVNGVSQTLETDASNGYANPTNPVEFGRRTVATQYFDGLMDEIRIYNRALSAPEILKHYQLLRR
jgi:hypothetical protein